MLEAVLESRYRSVAEHVSTDFVECDDDDDDDDDDEDEDEYEYDDDVDGD